MEILMKQLTEFLMVMLMLMVLNIMRYAVKYIETRIKSIENERIKMRLNDLMVTIGAVVDQYIMNYGELKERAEEEIMNDIQKVTTQSTMELIEKLGLNMREIIKTTIKLKVGGDKDEK